MGSAFSVAPDTGSREYGLVGASGKQHRRNRRLDLWLRFFTSMFHTSWMLDLKFAVDLVCLVGCVFYLDLILDVQALFTFYNTGDPKFLCVNLSAMVAAAVYTAVHIYYHGERLLEGLSRPEIFLLGISFVFQLHVVFLCWISWKQNKKHQLLIDSKFAEAAIEAVVSALVQTYAVVFRAAQLEASQMMGLYASILGSLVSISSAFAHFDSETGIDEAPGNALDAVTKLLLVWFFRLCELTSKLTSIALFQLATRTFYGGAIAVAIDCAFLALMTWKHGGQVSLAMPCVFALMNPMLETHNAVTLPHKIYYTWRVFCLVAMTSIVWYELGGLDGALTEYRHSMPVVHAWMLSTVGMLVLLPVVRYFAKSGLSDQKIYSLAEWARKPFSEAQQKLRDSTLKAGKQGIGTEAVDPLPVMLKPANAVLEVCKHMNRMAYNSFFEEMKKEPTNLPLSPPPSQFMKASLHIMYNCPIKEDAVVYHAFLNFTLETLLQNPGQMADLFVRTYGFHAVCNLILKECALTEEGLQAKMAPALTTLFIRGACSTLQHVVDPIDLQKLCDAKLPRAIAAATLELQNQTRGSDKMTAAIGEVRFDKIILSLSAAIGGKPQNDFSETGLASLLRGVANQPAGELELRVLVPQVLMRLGSSSPAFRTRLSAACGLCVVSAVDIMRQLDAALKLHGGSSVKTGESEALIRVEEGALTRCITGVQNMANCLMVGFCSSLQFLQLLSLVMADDDAKVVSRNLLPVILELEKSTDPPQKERMECVQQLRLLLGAKGNLAELKQGLTKDTVSANTVPSGMDEPLLSFAARAGKTESVVELLVQGASKLCVDSIGRTSQHSAIESGSTHLLPVLQVSAVGESPASLPTTQDNCNMCSSTPLLKQQSFQISCAESNLEQGKCPNGHDLVPTLKVMAAPLNLGGWRDTKGNKLTLRIRHGTLVASRLTGDFLWSCDGFEVGKSYPVTRPKSSNALDDPPAAQKTVSGVRPGIHRAGSMQAGVGNEQPDNSTMVKSMDHVVVDGEDLHYSHWQTQGYEGEVLFQGATVIFHGRGDYTLTRHDQVSIFGANVITSGVHFFEFEMHKVVCWTYVGLVSAKLGKEAKYKDSTGVKESYAYCVNPQSNRYTLQLGNTTVDAEKPKDNDVIGLLLDMDRHCGAFFLNQKQIGPEFKDVPEEVRLYAQQDSEGDRFTLCQRPPPEDLLKVLSPSATPSPSANVGSWQCYSCLSVHLDNHDKAVKCWSCETCRLRLCEGCRLGIGPLTDGRTGLSIGAWAGAEWDANHIHDALEDNKGCTSALNVTSCWSKKQLVEALLVATLGGHETRIHGFLEKLKSQQVVPAASCSVGIFAGGALNVADLNILQITRLAVHVALTASRPSVVNALLNFENHQLEEAKKDAPSTEEEEQAPTATSSAFSSIPGSALVFPDRNNILEPWFETIDMPRLLVALNSFCVTARRLQRHQYAMYPYTHSASGSRACQSCGFCRATMLCDTTQFAHCGICAHLAGRPMAEQLNDCKASIGELLTSCPASLQERTQAEVKLLPMPGDLLLKSRKGEAPSLMSAIVVKFVSTDKDGKWVTEPLVPDKQAPAEDQEPADDGDEDEGSKPLVKTVPYSENRQEEYNGALEYFVENGFGNSGCDGYEEFFEIVTLTDSRGEKMSSVMEFNEDLPESKFPLTLKYTPQIAYTSPAPALAYAKGCSGFHFAAVLPHSAPLDLLMAQAGAADVVDDPGVSAPTVDREDYSDSDSDSSPPAAQAPDPPAQEEMQSRSPLYDSPDGNGNSPLHLAAIANRVKQVGALLYAKADPCRKNTQGCTALMLALKFQSEDVLACLIEAVQSEGKLETTDAEGYTVLHHAVVAGAQGLATTRQLLQSAAAAAPVANGKTPLMLAAMCGNNEIVALLLDDKPAVIAKLSQKDEEGDSALIISTKRNNTSLISMLLKAGADYNESNGETGQIPLSLAKSVAAVAAICTGASREKLRQQPLKLSTGEGSVLSSLLKKTKGQALAEELLWHVEREALELAAAQSTDGREVEFLLHHSSIDNENAKDEVKLAHRKQIVSGIEPSVLTAALQRLVVREDGFGGTAGFLLDSGADMTTTLPLTIRKQNVVMLSVMLNEENAAKGLELLKTAGGGAASAARQCANTDTLIILGKALTPADAPPGQDWEKKLTEIKGNSADSQLNALQNYVKSKLPSEDSDVTARRTSKVIG